MCAESDVTARQATVLRKRIDAYFEKCREDDEPVTITGLALALNMTRESLLRYDKDDVCFEMIKEARLRVQNAYEKRLIKRGNTGDVFALKTFGWSDKPETEKKVQIKTALVSFGDEIDVSEEKRIDGGGENTGKI